MCTVRQTCHQEQFPMRVQRCCSSDGHLSFSTCQSQMLKVLIIPLTANAVLHARSNFFVVKIMATKKHPASTIALKQQTQNHSHMSDFSGLSKTSWRQKKKDILKRTLRWEGRLWDATSGRHVIFLKSAGLDRMFYYMIHARRPWCCTDRPGRHAGVVPRVGVLPVGAIDLSSSDMMIPASSAGVMPPMFVWGRKKLRCTVIRCARTDLDLWSSGRPDAIPESAV